MMGKNNEVFRRCLKDVALQLLGEPNKHESSKDELRFGSGRGSLSVDLRKGVWCDHATSGEASGGTIDLVRHVMKYPHGPEGHKAAVKWLQENRHIPIPEPRQSQPTAQRNLGEPTAIYDYPDEDGTLLFQVCRYEPKTFRQRVPLPGGKWLHATKGVRRVLYGLPYILQDVAAGKPIFIVEGEKTANRLRKEGIAATCSPGGAGKWRKEYSSTLKGADVIILPDNDEPGQDHAEKVSISLQGIAKKVRILNLPDLPDKGDPWDWMEAGNTAEKLLAIAKKAPVFGKKSKAEKKATITLPKAEPDWLQKCMRDDKGQVIPNVANVLLALRSDPAFSRLFAFDEMAQAPMLKQPIRQQAEPFETREVSDNDVTFLQERLQIAGLRRISKDMTHQAVDAVAVEHSYHPVRDYLNNLKWDGVPRLDDWLSDYLGAEPTPYTAGVGRLFLIAMVARIFQPGCKCDYMLILEGPQGAMKSSACAVLGGDYFSDSLPDLKTGKDVPLHLKNKWLVEIAELSAMGKADQETLKHFLTRQVERYRPPYGRRDVIEPRQCVLIGTTNKAVYLSDATGGRRFWPVKVGQIDIDELKNQRDQLFAEAVKAYRAGEKWWPDREFEADCIAPEQESRFEIDEWEGVIAAYLASQQSNRATIMEIATQAFFMERQKVDKTAQRKIADILTRLGWQRGPVSGGILRWIRPEKTIAPDAKHWKTGG